jgi:telomerase reverse transcriptase
MPHLLKELKFVKLREFLENYALDELPPLVDRVYIRTSRVPVISTFTTTLRGTEIVSLAIKQLLSQDPQNHLCAGYIKQSSTDSSSSMICYCPSTTLILLKSHEWMTLMRCIGDELTLFLLTECMVLQEMGGRYIFLAGRSRSLVTKEKSDVLDRCVIFQKHIRRIKFGSQDVFEYVFDGHDLGKYKKMQDSMRECLDRMSDRFKRAAPTPAFMSYFSDELDVENKHDVMQCSIEPARLSRFLAAVLVKLLKGTVFGHNLGVLRAKISLFVHRNRYETMSREELMRHFRVSEFGFFSCRRCTRHETTVRNRVAYRFLKYIFEQLLIPIISKYFYSTETSFSKFKVYYFPRASWKHFASIYTEAFLERFDLLKKPCLGSYSKIRCIPKRKGIRPIVNMSKSGGGSVPTNKQIYPEFCVLREEMANDIGNSVLNYGRIYERLREYLTRSSEPQYIIRLDLSSCFDNIQQAKLVELIGGLFSKRKYCLKSFVLVEKSCEEIRQRIVSKVVEKARPADSLMGSPEFARNRIVREIVTQKILLRNEMIRNLTDVVTNHVVKHGSRYYVQRTGIAQGLVLSTLFCSIYFAHIDRLYFNKAIGKGMLLRYVDDFLIMTPDVEEIKEFLRVSESLSHLGVNFSTEKFESNFGIEDHYRAGLPLDEILKANFAMNDKKIIWCGSIFSNRGFSVKPHCLDEYFTFSVAHSSSRPGAALMGKMGRLLKNKMALVYINKHNSKVYENVFDALFFCGKRLILFMKRLGFINPGFVHRLLEKSKRLVFKTCRDRDIGITWTKMDAMANRAFLEAGVIGYLETRAQERTDSRD